MKSFDQPIRILHVVGEGMVRAGMETSLMYLLRHIDRDRFRMDFLVNTTKACAYDDEIRALGSRIIVCPRPNRYLWNYDTHFRRVLREYGPYHVVHSHIHYFSGYVLRLCHQAGIPARITYSHNDVACVEAKAGLYRSLYRALMKRGIARHATAGLACSRQAAANLFGSTWEQDARWQVLNYGIDLAPFQDHVDSLTVRSELGIPADAFVMGHIGRFAEQKNHTFLIEIAKEVAERDSKMCLLLLGEGPLRPSIEQKVAQMGLVDRVIFAGSRPDVARLMLGAMDLFVFPSLHEGLGMVLVEAQAAGLPCVFSNVAPTEVDVVKPLVCRMSLNQTAAEWAEALLRHRASASPVTQADALKQIEASVFNAEISTKYWEDLYQTQLNHLTVDELEALRTRSSLQDLYTKI